MTTTIATVHVSPHGTYHPTPEDPIEGASWTIHDTRGYIDPGPSCDECGACDCDAEKGLCPVCGETAQLTGRTTDGRTIYSCGDASRKPLCHGEECIGLAFSFTCLDGGESLCEDCAEREGITIVPCDCE